MLMCTYVGGSVVTGSYRPDGGVRDGSWKLDALMEPVEKLVLVLPVWQGLASSTSVFYQLGLEHLRGMPVGQLKWFQAVKDVLLKLSVGVTRYADLLGIEGLLTQGSRPGRALGESVCGSFEMDSSDWSNGIRYHVFATRSDTEFKVLAEC